MARAQEGSKKSKRFISLRRTLSVVLARIRMYIRGLNLNPPASKHTSISDCPGLGYSPQIF